MPPTPRLSVPATFGDSQLWADPAHVGFYVRLQLRADGRGRIEGWSLRNLARWLNASLNQVRRLVRALEDAGLLNYPEGQPSNRPYPVELRDFWGQGHTAKPPPETLESTQHTPAPQKPRNRANATQQNRELFPGMATQQKAEKSTNRLMAMVHKLGLDEDPRLTGPLWAKQARVIGRLVEQHGADATEAAIRGVPNLWPWSEPDGPPWDAFDVERQFMRAVAAQGRAESAKRVAGAGRQAARRYAQQKEAREKEHERELEKWLKRATRAIREEPREVQREYAVRAEEELADVYGRTSKEFRRRMVRHIGLRLYGEEHGDPPPPRV